MAGAKRGTKAEEKARVRRPPVLTTHRRSLDPAVTSLVLSRPGDAASLAWTLPPHGDCAVDAVTCAPPFWSEEALNPQVQSPLDCFDAAAKSISDCPDPRARIENSSNLGFPEVISDESQTASVNLSGELVGSNVASADRPNAISAIADGTEFEVVEGFRFNRNVAISRSGVRRWLRQIMWQPSIGATTRAATDRSLTTVGDYESPEAILIAITGRMRSPCGFAEFRDLSASPRHGSRYATPV